MGQARMSGLSDSFPAHNLHDTLDNLKATSEEFQAI
jgi:hypothetical protein